VEISLLEGLTLHQKVVYETLSKYCNFYRVLGHTRLLYAKAAATIKIVPCNQPQAQDGQADKGTVFSRLGPQPPVPSLPPQVQGHSQDHDIPVASRRDDGSEADHVITNGWVIVHSRQKSNKQHKGKAVVVSEPVFVDNSPATPFPSICTGIVQNSPKTDTLVATPCAGEVRGSSPSRTAPLVVYPRAGEAHNLSPPRTNSLVTNTGDVDMAGKSVNAPLLDVSVQCGVRTRNQK